MGIGVAASADRAGAGAGCRAGASDESEAPVGLFEFECRGPDGTVKWRERCSNIVTTAGKRLNLDVTFGATAKPSWFMLLAGAGAKAAGDTLAAHAGWTEVTAYTGTRPAITFTASTVANTTGAQVTHASAIAFAINADATVIAGAGVCNAASGTTGTLYNVGDFPASRTMANGDTLSVTITLSQAA